MLFLLFLLVGASALGPPSDGDLCSVYDPFKVLPENNKFQIGGSFPLHGPDCRTLRPEVVQEIVSIQWALTHWNQNPLNAASKLGLYAGDTCSRGREALSQSLRFLDSVGYHEPSECRSEGGGPRLLGVIAPRDAASSIALASLLAVSELPVAAYSTEGAATMQATGVQSLIATTPTVQVFVDALIRLLSSLRSNLVAIVEDRQEGELTRAVTGQLREADIHVAEILPTDHPLLARALNDSDSTIIVSLLNKTMLADILAKDEINRMDKLWISVPVSGEAMTTEELTAIVPDTSLIEFVSVQPRVTPLPQFRDYFLRVLKNNYASYALLTTYVQQVYGCKGEDCQMDRQSLLDGYSQTPSAEAVIRMTYAFAAVGAAIGADENKMALCKHATAQCTELVLHEFLKLDFLFGLSDPSELVGQRLRFFRSRHGLIVAEGMGVEALRVSAGSGTVTKVLDYKTALHPEVVASPMKPADARLRSICAPFRPFCGQCHTIVPANGARYFLSVPQHYPLYIVALFDMHEGPSCSSQSNSDISLPMAFVHTVWTFKQRFPQLAVLQNLELGALLVDTCGSGKQAVESVVRAESHCFRFPQAGRNITVVPGSVFGYVSSLKAQSGQSLRGFFSSGEAETAFVSVDGEQLAHSFSALPPGRTQTSALIRLLVHHKWTFVSVALAENDGDSLSLFAHFERMAHESGVCIAEVVSLTQERTLPLSSSTNVTIIFSTARLAASFLLSSTSPLHILMGDAHDSFLFSNRSFSGTLSVQPKDIVYDDFREWASAATPLSLPELWFWSYVEYKHECALSQSSKFTYGRMCSGDELIAVPSLGRMTRAGYLARGVERLLFSLDSVYRKLCPQQLGLCPDFYSKGRKVVAETLARARPEDEMEVLEMRENGFVVVGNWSQSEGLSMGAVEAKATLSHCSPPLCRCFLDSDFFKHPMESFVAGEAESPSGSYIRRQPVGGEILGYSSVAEHWREGEWRRSGHNLILLLVITLLVVLSISLLALILMKIHQRIVKGNQSLGIILLIGIIFLFVASYFFVFDATDLVCRLRVTAHGLAYALCFGVMIAKATQLRNAETLGFGNAIHISFWNYWLLLFFIVGVQMALSLRWWLEPFLATLDSSHHMQCTVGREEFAVANSYVIILLALALFLNSRNRSIKRNYKETKWLFFASASCAIVWAVWAVAFFLLPLQFKDISVVVSLLSCGCILLSFLFFPKIYILLSYEPVVVEFKQDVFPPIELFEKGEEGRGGGASTNFMAGDSLSFPQDEGPIFATIMRKKKLRRTRSESERSANGRSPTHSQAFSMEGAVARSHSGRSEESAHELPMERRLGH